MHLAVPLETVCEIAEEFWTSTRRDLWRTEVEITLTAVITVMVILSNQWRIIITD